MEENPTETVQMLENISADLRRIKIILAKMVIGMSGQPVQIDIEKDLDIKFPREIPLIVPGTRQ